MSNPDTINFASENFAGVQRDMMQALTDANVSHVPSYGKDHFTADAIDLLKETLGNNIEVYFTFNGTGANNFGLGCVAEKYHAIYCSDVAHLYVDESTAPESFVGCRIYPVNSQNGKIKPDDLRIAIKRKGDIHHPQPRVVSITQPTEYGTVYTIEELKAIKAACIENDMLLHVDGARFFNAAVYLGCTLKQMSADAGIDILTLGGTKAGMMFGEAVIFFHQNANSSYKFNLKRSMQLASKNRFIAAQFQAMLKNELWRSLAAYTNALAKTFEKQIAHISTVKVGYPVETNAVFLNISKPLYQKMQPYANFYYWSEQKNEARLIFSFDNTEKEIADFAALLAEYAKD
jgi:threonine aldolase